MQSSPLLEVTNLTKRFGGITAVSRCSLALEPRRIYGLIGPNGSGKTTLFNLITGLDPPDEGEVCFKGERIDGLKPHQIARRGIGRTFQIVRVFPGLTALENLLVVGRTQGDVARRRALELLERVKLDRLKGEYAGNLSHGQRRVLEFVRVLMVDPELLLLDEPAAGVNRTLLSDLLAAIQGLKEQGKTIVVVEHDMKVVMGLSEKLFVLDFGEKIAEGPPQAIQRDERVMEAYFGR